MGRALDPRPRRGAARRLPPGGRRVLSARRAAAAATLAGLGLDADAIAAGRADADALVRVLEGPDGGTAADALGDLAAPPVAALLATVEPRLASRAARKAVRRALYRLGQRGVPVPARAAPPPARPVAAPEIEGWMSHVDGRGDRAVWLVASAPAGATRLVAAQVNEPEGLRDLQEAEVTRKKLRAARRQLETQAHLRLVPVPWRILDALLVEAEARSGDAGRGRGWAHARARLTSEPPAPPAEPVSRRVAAPADADAAALVAGSVRLFDEPELASWWPPSEALAPFVGEIAAVRDSPLVLNRLQQEERLREVLGRAAATLIPVRVFARRLEANAYVFAETGRAEAARTALATAAALRARPAEAHAVPFVAGYVERALGRLLAEVTAEQEERAQSSLVVTPQEFMRDRSASRPPRIRG
ncbi:MAG TPA: hypothetical protein VFD84_12855 [Candidatus Binatia bacterium]|nr:hypothetical protein [Candidatus Binatia bacterium]